MSDKCTLDGNLINRCDMLAKALEYGNPSYRSKGAFIPERVNFNTGKPASILRNYTPASMSDVESL
ncbi:hypothetical protein ENINMM101M1_05675 [Enterobacter intestinihominis]